MSKIFLHFILIISIFLFSEVSESIAQGSRKPIQIFGKVLEAEHQNPIEFAPIVVLDKTTDQQITGITTDINGNFQLSTTHSNFYIRVSFIGFKTQKIEDFKITGNQIDLGQILLEPDVALMDEVTITAQKSQTVFKLDKRVFNVGQDLLNSGGSAVDVLNNVPSVSVSIEGDISLRGNANVQILVNGKPSVLTADGSQALGTITADMIERVEVITNPSVKYDAEGTTGIINIVLKKEEKKGINGSVTLNTGTPKNHSIGGSFNYRTEKINVFSQLGIGVRMFPADYETLSINRNSLSTSSLKTIGDSEKQEQFYNFLLGLDYHLNRFNVLTLSGHYAYEIEDETSDMNYLLTETGQSSSTRSEVTEATNPKWQYEMHYKKSFANHKKRHLMWSAMGSFFGKKKDSFFENANAIGNFSDFQQRAATDFQELEYTFQVDYAHPFAEKMMLEVGARYVISDISNDYEVEDFENEIWQFNSNFTNIFEFSQNVLASYGAYSYEGKKLGIKIGLRVENTDMQTLLKTTEETHNQDYTNLFPSLHTSYKFKDGLALQASYSRRIHRPRLWDLNPFFTLRDNFNIRTGNPNLLPEYTDSYEVTSIHELSDVSLNLAIFHQRTDQVIEHVTTVDSENITTTQPQNIGTNYRTGLEINAEYTPTKSLSLSSDFNWGYFNRKGTFNNTNFDLNSQNWSARLNAKLNLGKGINAQLSGRYRSKIKELTQTQRDNYFIDFGIRKKVLQGRGVLNLSIRDLFSTRRDASIIDLTDYYVSNSRKRGRFIVFGFSYGFGKGDAMEFSGHKQF